MSRLKLLLISFFICTPLFANSLDLIINGKAIHDNKHNYNYNEENLGFGFEYNFSEDNEWITFVNGGFFKDSFLNNSKYLGGGIKRRFLLTDDKDSWHLDAGLNAFLMTRKDHKSNNPFFGALPFVSLGTSRFEINATYIPAVRPKMEALLFFQASVKLARW